MKKYIYIGTYGIECVTIQRKKNGKIYINNKHFEQMMFLKYNSSHLSSYYYNYILT